MANFLESRKLVPKKVKVDFWRKHENVCEGETLAFEAAFHSVPANALLFHREIQELHHAAPGSTDFNSWYKLVYLYTEKSPPSKPLRSLQIPHIS